MRPFLKWAGGKRQILSHIKQFINNEVMTENAVYKKLMKKIKMTQ